VLDGLVDGVGERGDALVVCGEPGIGKSALLAMASRRAADRGMQILSATGVRSEGHSNRSRTRYREGGVLTDC
jgi:predicted ATP-dependent serine protease